MERDVVAEMTPVAEGEHVRVERAQWVAPTDAAGRVQVGDGQADEPLRPKRGLPVSLLAPPWARRRAVEATVPETLALPLGALVPDPPGEGRPVGGVETIAH